MLANQAPNKRIHRPVKVMVSYIQMLQGRCGVRECGKRVPIALNPTVTGATQRELAELAVGTRQSRQNGGGHLGIASRDAKALQRSVRTECL
jgi:hypothetical protein